ncbi:MAG: ParB N-terminal domain-containing protein [Spirochaetes bacterium]|nr:ParB N-terminal domain-containing protein [Spirochaetota bacterium]MBU1079298.1 ParB N-terminal domain-containing protein [Spirochaetota bacterium]
MQVEIASIRIMKRVRKELRDIDQLAESLNRFGQLHPIVITRRKVLISGRRRLEAAKTLGWTNIEATVLGRSDAAQRLELELEENVQRVPLGRDELEAAIERLERLRHPGFFMRIWNAIVRFVRRVFGVAD